MNEENQELNLKKTKNSWNIYSLLLGHEKWFSLEMKPSRENDFYKIFTDELSREIKIAESFIYIVSGELNSRIWNNKKIVRSFLASKAKDIKILCGPEIDIKSIAVIKLIADKKIKIYSSKKRQTIHFVVTDKAVFVEEAHRKFEGVKKISVRRMSEKDIFILENLFKKKIFMKENIEPEEILKKFNLKIYNSDSKENNRKPTQNEINNFMNEISKNI